MNIQEKCEQYWNEPRICVEEVHAILEWIHHRANENDKELERLRMDRYDNPKERERDFKDVLETLEDEELWTESNTLRELFGLKDKEIERLRKALETVNTYIAEVTDSAGQVEYILLDKNTVMKELQQALKEGE